MSKNLFLLFRGNGGNFSIKFAATIGTAYSNIFLVCIIVFTSKILYMLAVTLGLVKNTRHYGVVISSKDNIAEIFGLTEATSGEMVINTKGLKGLVLNLGRHYTGVVTFINNSFGSGN